MALRSEIAAAAAKCAAAVLVGTMLLTGCGGEPIKEVDVETLQKGNANTGGSLHDPFVIEGDDGTFYCYGSHMTAATSSDLYKWKSWANGVTKNNKIYDNLLVEPFDAFAYVGKGEQGETATSQPSATTTSSGPMRSILRCSMTGTTGSGWSTDRGPAAFSS